MGNISEHFSKWEFACKGNNCCNHSCFVSEKLIAALEELRKIVGVALIVNSGFRCKEHNKAVRGARDSYHIVGYASDIRTPPHLTDDEFAALAEQVESFKNGGIGIYHGRIHVDVRLNGPARWDARGVK